MSSPLTISTPRGTALQLVLGWVAGAERAASVIRLHNRQTIDCSLACWRVLQQSEEKNLGEEQCLSATPLLNPLRVAPISRSTMATGGLTLNPAPHLTQHD